MNEKFKVTVTQDTSWNRALNMARRTCGQTSNRDNL